MKKKETQKAKKTKSFFFLYLSLILCIFCFFIFLISQMQFEKTKIIAVQESLNSVFKGKDSLKQSFFKATIKSNPDIEMSVKALFDKQSAQISSLKSGGVFAATSLNDLFVPNEARIRAYQKEFLNRLAVWLKQNPQYLFDFFIQIDLPVDKDYPVFSTLSMQRTQSLLSSLLQRGVPERQVSIGIIRARTEQALWLFRTKENNR